MIRFDMIDIENFIYITKSSISAREAARRLDLPIATYIRYAKKLDVYDFDTRPDKGQKYNSHKNGQNRKYNFDLTFFDNIDTPEKAYILGFISADGSVSKDGYRLKIDIQRRDREFLEEVCHCINLSDECIYDQVFPTEHKKNGLYEMSGLTLYSKHIVDNLQKYNIVYDKEHKDLDFLENIPSDYVFAWLAGYIDGDGCISKDKYRLSLITNNRTAIHIAKILAQHHIRISYDKLYDNGINVSLCVYDKVSAILLSTLYLNACNFHLSRKSDRARNMLNMYMLSSGRGVHTSEYLDQRLFDSINQRLINNSVENKRNYCKKCGELISRGGSMCRKCAYLHLRKVDRPSRDMLEYDIHNMSFVKVGVKYGVSDNTIRKWCKQYNLPYKKSDMQNI